MKWLEHDLTSAEEEAVRVKMSDARLALLIRYPFYGALAISLKLVEAYDIPTAATDMRRIIYNPKFIHSLNFEETLFVFGHELCHCLFGFFIRKGDRDSDIFNDAADYVTNWFLSQEQFKTDTGQIVTGIGKMPMLGGLFEARFANMTAEEVYEILKKEGHQGGQSFDYHIEMSDEELKDAKEFFSDQVIKASKCVTPGQLPGSVKQFLKNLLDPVIDWREIIESKVQSLQKNDLSFMYPSRRSWNAGVILAGRTPGERINVCCFIDSSVSVDDSMILNFFSELQGMMNQFQEYTIMVGCFDTIVHEESIKLYTENDSNLEDYIIYGRGGTHFGSVWEYFKDHEVESDLLIILTDGECGFKGCDSNVIDTVWLVNSKYSICDFDPPFGQVAFYKKET